MVVVTSKREMKVKWNTPPRSPSWEMNRRIYDHDGIVPLPPVCLTLSFHEHRLKLFILRSLLVREKLLGFVLWCYWVFVEMVSRVIVWTHPHPLGALGIQAGWAHCEKVEQWFSSLCPNGSIWEHSGWMGSLTHLQESLGLFGYGLRSDPSENFSASTNVVLCSVLLFLLVQSSCPISKISGSASLPSFSWTAILVIIFLRPLIRIPIDALSHSLPVCIDLRKQTSSSPKALP